MAFRRLGTVNIAKLLPQLTGNQANQVWPVPYARIFTVGPPNHLKTLYNLRSHEVEHNFNFVQPHRGFHVLRQLTPEIRDSLFSRTCSPIIQNQRGLIQFGFKGRRKTVKAVVKRFYRLDWGAWIRPRAGRANRLWRKGAKQRKRARTHVFCNSQQSFMLDKMVARFWHRKKYYVDDPYETYHSRPNFWITRRM